MPLDAQAAEQLAARIASGHAWREHRVEFPSFTGVEDFADSIRRILIAPSAERILARGGRAYWDDGSATIVIVSTNDPDGGTAFRPTDQRVYFDTVPSGGRQ